MEPYDYYFEEGFPFHRSKLEQVKAFLSLLDLTYDEKIEYSINLCNAKGEILATGSRHQNTLKCIAVLPEYQGEGFVNKIMTHLLAQAYERNVFHLFLFTKPSYGYVFEDLGFYPILATDTILLMENKKSGIQDYIRTESKDFVLPYADAPIGAIVMNANPFTKGHLYLIETALQSCAFLHVFVLSTDSSEFPAAVRLRLVQEGCAHLSNIAIHGSSDYLISHATFPDYFIKDKDFAPVAAGSLDLQLFCDYFRDAFHITRRYIGEEPFSPITKAYNEQMKHLLPPQGIQVLEIPRFTQGVIIISATFVRKAFLEGNLEVIQNLVPASTYAYLQSPDGAHLRDKLLSQTAPSH